MSHLMFGVEILDGLEPDAPEHLTGAQQPEPGSPCTITRQDSHRLALQHTQREKSYP
jgi:hypothetical protein